jgi:hypothetical protein
VSAEAAAPTVAARATRAECLLLCAGVLAFGCVAAWLGQSNNWDLRNYHWYDGWAWLSGRGAQDLAAAQAQTWFNPTLPALLYLLLSTLPPWLGTFVLGAVQGLNLVPLHRIAVQLLPPALLQRRRWLALLVALVGATGATQRGELGAGFGDNLVSLPLLCALALLLPPRPGRGRIAAAGALLGLAAGLKLTAAPVASGIVLAAPLLFVLRGAVLRHWLLLAGCALAGFLLVNGHWMWQLWREFGNPLFPLFGSVFGGDFVAPAELRDTRWLPRGALEWLFYPLVWADQPRRVSELWFLDLRLPLLFLALLALPLWRRRARAASPQPHALDFVLLAVALAYLLWLALFGYYRYLVVLEMLAPLLLVVALLALPWRIGLATACAVLVLVGLATRPPRWGRLAHYGDHYVEVTLPARAQAADALVVFGSREPLSFLAPAFPDGTRFVRIVGNVLGPPLPEWALDRAVHERLHRHDGPLLLLASDIDDTSLQAALRRHRLTVTAGACDRVDSNLLDGATRPQLCALRTLPPGHTDSASPPTQ